MQPGEKTRAPLRTRESDQVHASAHLWLTVVLHPDLTRIGASMKLGVVDASGVMRLDATVIGRSAPLFRDDPALAEQHLSRRALIHSHHSKISRAAIAQRLKQLGASK